MTTAENPILLPAMSVDQAASWRGLMELFRADPTMLETFTGTLLELGFTPDTSGDGLQHRWRREGAQLDVLLPGGVGERASQRAGAGGAPSLPTPGGTQALHRTEAVAVVVEGTPGHVLRPDLVGALVMKAAAHTVGADGAVRRHRLDFIALAALVARQDFRTETLSKKDLQRLRDMVARCRIDSSAMALESAIDSLQRLEQAGAPQRLIAVEVRPRSGRQRG